MIDNVFRTVIFFVPVKQKPVLDHDPAVVRMGSIVQSLSIEMQNQNACQRQPHDEQCKARDRQKYHPFQVHARVALHLLVSNEVKYCLPVLTVGHGHAPQQRETRRRQRRVHQIQAIHTGHDAIVLRTLQLSPA